MLLRLAVVLLVPTQPTSDFWSYYHRGLNLAEHGRYEARPGQVDATYPPLYSILLAGAFLLAPGHALLAGKLLNCLLGVSTIVLGSLLARRLGGDRAGVIAGSFLAFFPRYLLMPCLLASENLFSPLLLLFAMLVLQGARSPRARGVAAGAGLVLALTALTRTVAYFLGGLWVLAALAARKRVRTALVETVFVLAVQHAVMLPWALRNETRLGRFTFLNTAGGYGLFLGNNPRANGLWYDGRADLEKAAPGVFSRGDVAISDASNRAAWDWIRESPSRALALYARKFAIIFKQSDIIASFTISASGVVPPVPGIDVLPGPHFLKRHLPAVGALLSFAAWTITALGVAGWIALGGRARRTRAPAHLAAALVLPAAALYVPAVSALIAVNGRYRWPVEDLMVPVAALALARAAERIRAGRAASSEEEPTGRETGLDAAPALSRFELAVLAIAGGILAYQLFVPPIVGLADDGDFAKIMGQVGLQFRSKDYNARYYGFLLQTYDICPPWWPSGYLTSELPLVAAARFYAGGFPARGAFDIRSLGALHSFVFLAGLALLLIGSRGWKAPVRLLFAGLLVFVFTDVGYAALFNSLYSATASYLSLFLLAGIVLCLAGGSGSPAVKTAYWIAALCLVTSKPQESALAPLLAALAYLLARAGRGPGSRRVALWLGVALCTAGSVYYYRTPLYLKSEALYNDVFLQLLPNSRDPRAALAELGLPEGWIKYSGTHAYVPNVPLKDPGFREEFLRRVGFRRILGFYLRRPERLMKLFRSAAENAFRLRPIYLGNFSASAGGKPRELSRAFGAWSAAKERLDPSGPWLLPVFWLASLAGAIRIWSVSASPRRRCLTAAAAVLVTLSIVEFLTCSLGDALADVARHLHCFNAMADLLAIGATIWLISSAASLARAFVRGGPALDAAGHASAASLEGAGAG